MCFKSGDCIIVGWLTIRRILWLQKRYISPMIVHSVHHRNHSINQGFVERHKTIYKYVDDSVLCVDTNNERAHVYIEQAHYAENNVYL